MFAKLNNRITRTIAATLIPAAMTFGLAGNTFASVNWATPRQVAQMQPSNSLTFTGTANNGATITLQMFYVSPKSVNGVITINGVAYPFVAYVEGDNLTGVLNDNGTQVRFDATGQANLLNVDFHGTTVTLQLVS
jgi:hypothetical protein